MTETGGTAVIAERQFVAHFEIADQDVDTAVGVFLFVDLAAEAVQQVELLVGYIPHRLEKRLELVALLARHDKVHIG